MHAAASAVPRATNRTHVAQIVTLDGGGTLHQMVRAGLDRSRPVLPRHIAQALLFRPRAGPRAFGDAITPQSLSHGGGIGASNVPTTFDCPATLQSRCRELALARQRRAACARHQERKWTATVAADASRCAIGFMREKEESRDRVFREQFLWPARSVPIGLDFWFDEAVGDCWIHSHAAARNDEERRRHSAASRFGDERLPVRPCTAQAFHYDRYLRNPDT